MGFDIRCRVDVEDRRLWLDVDAIWQKWIQWDRVVPGKSNAIFHHAINGIDRFQTNVTVVRVAFGDKNLTRLGLDRAIRDSVSIVVLQEVTEVVILSHQGTWCDAVAHDRDVVLATSGQMDGADVAVLGAERSTRQIVNVWVRVNRVRLVVSDVGVSTDENQLTIAVIDSERRITTVRLVGVVHVKDDRHCAGRVVDAADHLDASLSRVKAIPVDVQVAIGHALLGPQVAGDRDRCHVALQKALQRLSLCEGVVCRCLDFARFTEDVTACWQSTHVDGCGGVPHVGVLNRTARILIDLLQSDLHLVLATADTIQRCRR
ncbi:hypothetical protein RISK_002633 [Rhodopirellula islandica]|uniref:Uncharacterized protein n=1 Tax=Rhodopirellula islandica TaxID=595434 RepID=A0A0J1BFW0_RHOIS|nr:hypothetical protein RISK_002633 [Rhodopirellula islandica]